MARMKCITMWLPVPRLPNSRRNSRSKSNMVNTTLFDLTGKVALLTGASKGMGRAMAEALAAHGATVVISSRKQDQLDAAAEEINQACGAKRAHAIAANAGRKNELQALVDKTRE